MKQRISCTLGLHKWSTTVFAAVNGYRPLRQVCQHCPTRRYGWRSRELNQKPFGWTDDRSAWDGHPGILDPKRKKVTR